VHGLCREINAGKMRGPPLAGFAEIAGQLGCLTIARRFP
jgi:hypothetical protein